MKSIWVVPLAVVWALLLPGCTAKTTRVETDVAEDIVCAPVVPDVVAVDGLPVTDTPVTADAADVQGPRERVVGGVCTTDDDCRTPAVVASGLPVFCATHIAPDDTAGMCTILCWGATTDCGPDAACSNLGALHACAPTCETFADCRYGQNYICTASGGASAPKTCIPGADAAVARCGDGVCDESEKNVATECPADCPNPQTPPLPVGAACTQNRDCGGGYMCLNKQALAGLGLDFDVPGGMCSKLGCTKDADCGAGGLCFDSQPFTGSSIKLCLHACADGTDCRYVERYTCFAVGTASACLPSVIVAAIRCGDGVCDASEAADPTQCDSCKAGAPPGCKEDCPRCGDGHCEADAHEDHTTCPEDCP